jgi:hypothetical protein
MLLFRRLTGEPSDGAGKTKAEVTRSTAKLIHLLIVGDEPAIEFLILDFDGPGP